MEDWRAQIAAQAAQAEVSGGRREYLSDGDYVLIVENLKMIKGRMGTSFVAEFVVEKSRPTEPGKQPSPVGARVASVFNTTKYPETAFGNIHALALAISGYSKQEVDESQVEENQRAANEGRQPRNIFQTWILRATNTNPSEGTVNPCRGRRVAATTFRQANRDQKERQIPRDKWNCYPQFRSVPNTPESVADACAKLDGAAFESASPPAPVPPAPVPAPVPPAPVYSAPVPTPAPAAPAPAPAFPTLKALGL